MININLPSKKTWGKTRKFYTLLNDKYDQEYARVFTLLNNRMTKNNNKQELDIKLANLYDGKIIVSSYTKGNILIINYSISCILDNFLPMAIANDGIALFDELLQYQKFQPKDIYNAIDELKLSINQSFENNENVASFTLNNNLYPDYTLTEFELTEFYNNFSIDKFEKWQSELSFTESFDFSFNCLPESLEYSKISLPFEFYEPNQFNNYIVKKQTSQCNVCIAFKLPEDDIIINNLINYIIGGDVFSKLFKIIREELSLSYNISSYLKNRNLIIINGGINIDSIDLALSKIEDIINDVKIGKFKQEFELGKIKYLELVKRNQNQPTYLLNFHEDNFLFNQTMTVDDLLNKISQVEYSTVMKYTQDIKKIGQVIVK